MPVLVAGNAPDPVALESQLMPVVYVTVGAVGALTGIAAGMLVIVLVNASGRY